MLFSIRNNFNLTLVNDPETTYNIATLYSITQLILVLFLLNFYSKNIINLKYIIDKEEKMRRNKKFAIFLVFMSFAIAGVLQILSSSNKEHNLSYLATLENNLVVLDEKLTRELNTYSGLNTVRNPLHIDYFVEEKEIIEEFIDQMHGKSASNIMTSYNLISRINDSDLDSNTYVYSDIPQLQTLEAAARETKNFLEYQQFISNQNNEVTHKIKANDNLYNLAIKYYNNQSKWKIIYQANKNQMQDPDSLQVGQELRIPVITTYNEIKQKQTPQSNTLVVNKHIM